MLVVVLDPVAVLADVVGVVVVIGIAVEEYVDGMIANAAVVLL